MTQRGKTQQVLVADDQLLFRSGVRTLLSAESDLRIAGEASTFAEAVMKEVLTRPDVIVISASLLATSLPSERDQVREWARRASLVLISDSDSVADGQLLREIGPAVSLQRSTAAAQIVGAIRQASWMEKQSSTDAGRTAADLKALAEAQSAKPSVLTLREQEVVRLLAEGRTVRETATELSLSIKTIDAHKLNVMRKLDIHNREKLIQYAISHGIVAVVPV